MDSLKLQILKGTRDFLPSQFMVRQKVVDIIRQSFERFGFEPMETPALEYAETLEGKYGEEGDRLIYKFADRGERMVALRYDLTVPLARAVAMYQVGEPFRRYQISPVWRADKPQKGRFREFWQCDADIVGSREMWADAEVIALTSFTLKQLGFEQFMIRLNNRKLLNGIAMYGGIEEKEMANFFRTIDKSEKIGWDRVKEELQERGFAGQTVEKTIDMLLHESQGGGVSRHLKDALKEIPVAREGIAEIEEIQDCLDNLGADRGCIRFDSSLARGLDYYTGPIFETVIEKPRIGSISGGGRFDGLIGMFSERNIPATGTSLGLERIIAIMEELTMIPHLGAVSEVLVTVFNRSLVGASMSLVADLRLAGVNAEVYAKDDKLKKQLTYAHHKGIPLVVIIGPDENEKGVVEVRDMRLKAQISSPRGEAVERVVELLRD
jgi:histidyl-tRNA synthetase